MTADDKYSLLSKNDSMRTIHMDLSQKQKGFFIFFCVFLKSTLNFEKFEKKMILIAYVFPKLRTPENVDR